MMFVTSGSGAALPINPTDGESNTAGLMGRDIADLAAESIDGAVSVQQLTECGWTPDQINRLHLHGSAFAARRLNPSTRHA